MKPLPGVTTHPAEDQSLAAAAANTLLRYRKQDLDKLQLATRPLTAGSSFGDGFFMFITVIAGMIDTITFFFVLYASLQALLA